MSIMVRTTGLALLVGYCRLHLDHDSVRREPSYVALTSPGARRNAAAAISLHAREVCGLKNGVVMDWDLNISDGKLLWMWMT